MLWDSDDDSEYDDDMKDEIDTEIVDKLNGKEGTKRCSIPNFFTRFWVC